MIQLEEINDTIITQELRKNPAIGYFNYNQLYPIKLVEFDQYVQKLHEPVQKWNKLKI